MGYVMGNTKMSKLKLKPNELIELEFSDRCSPINDEINDSIKILNYESGANIEFTNSNGKFCITVFEDHISLHKHDIKSHKKMVDESGENEETLIFNIDL